MPPEAVVLSAVVMALATFAMGIKLGQKIDRETAERAADLLEEDAAKWSHATAERWERLQVAAQLKLITGAKP
jgi:hypothetical protein